MQLDLTSKTKTEEVDTGIEYTKKIVAALKGKVKEHNEAHKDKKITFSRAKDVFLEGLDSRESLLVYYGFARLNMFLRLLTATSIAHEFRASTPKEATKSLIINFSNYISPRDEDFARAQEDIDKYKLQFEVKSVDELYFDVYGNVLPYEEYL